MSAASNLDVTWIDEGREPQMPADPGFPEGIDLDVSAGAAMTCRTSLPYPAKRIGMYLVACRVCGQRIVCTTAGRRDDPRSIRLACKRRAGK